VRKILAGSQNAIVESNSILRFLKPDLYLTVLDPATADFKASAQSFLDRADAVLWHSHETVADPAWKTVSPKAASHSIVFPIQPPNYVTPAIIDFVRQRLESRG
jgi:hypothetical protein